MRQVFLLLCLLIAVRSIEFDFPKQNLPNLTFTQQELYFEQRLNHFDISDNRKWNQRYFKADLVLNNEQSKNVLIYICGEGPCSGIPKARTFPIRIAKQMDMKVFALEHRFYGKSQPFLKDHSTIQIDNQLLSVDNLRYLTVEQAIEDLASFIQYLKEVGNIPEDAKILTIGGSYPGALSAWFNQKYGHLVKASYSSSGVIKIIKDFYNYDETIYKVLSNYDQQNQENCVKRVQLHIKQIQMMELQELEILIKNNMGEQYVLSELQDMRMMISDMLAGTVQYSHKSVFCKNLAQVKKIEEFFQLLKKSAESLGTVDGQDYNRSFLQKSFYDINNPKSSRQWLYQICTQMGWFQTPYYTEQSQNVYSKIHSLLFNAPRVKKSNVLMRFDSLTIEYYDSLCKAAFGFGIQEQEIKNCQNRYAGESIKNPNIIFVNSQDDPWQTAGLLHNTFYQKRVHYVKCKGDCGHCIDLSTFTQDQDSGITLVQDQILEDVKQLYSMNE